MESRLRPLIRAFGLLWSRMGRARYYIVGAIVVLFVFAAIGLAHLLSPRPARDTRQSPKEPDSKVTEPIADNPVITITEIGATETKGRNGQTNVAVKIGVAPRANAGKGEVEIRVAFFDLTAAGEMRPTDAQVNYEWLTPVRNWADPAPKYLIATYQGSGMTRESTEKLRYGGFLVRVYFAGQLQAMRSEPKELVAALRNGPKSVPTEGNLSTPTPRSVAAQLRPPEPQPSENSRVPDRVSLSAPPVQVSKDNSALPYASPVPDKPGFVYSPYNPKFLIDVRGFPPGTEVVDPHTSKRFKVP